MPRWIEVTATPADPWTSVRVRAALNQVDGLLIDGSQLREEATGNDVTVSAPIDLLVPDVLPAGGSIGDRITTAVSRAMREAGLSFSGVGTYRTEAA